MRINTPTDTELENILLQFLYENRSIGDINGGFGNNPFSKLHEVFEDIDTTGRILERLVDDKYINGGVYHGMRNENNTPKKKYGVRSYSLIEITNKGVDRIENTNQQSNSITINNPYNVQIGNQNNIDNVSGNNQ